MRSKKSPKSSPPPAELHTTQELQEILSYLSGTCLSPNRRNQNRIENIYKRVIKNHRKSGFNQYRRAHSLKILLEEILQYADDPRSAAMTPTQIELDSVGSSEDKLDSFLLFFKRLRPRDRALLLLRDKFEIPWPELATVFELPEDTLRLIRQQSLTRLEGWVWND